MTVSGRILEWPKRKGTRVSILALLGFAGGLTPAAFAVEAFRGATSATISYSSGRINLTGISRPGAGQNRAGLAAEIEARKQGLERLETELGRICKETSLAPRWKSAVRSLGSEIYGDATIRILLSASITEVVSAFSETKAVKIQALDGRPVMFRIPSAIPLLSTQCGSMGFEAGQRILRVFPSVAKSSGNALEIELSWDKTRSILVPAGAADQTLLGQTSLLAEAANLGASVIRLPIRASQ